MDASSDLNDAVDAILIAQAVIDKHGTREIRRLSRTLLLTLGREIARRSKLSSCQSVINQREI